VVRDPDGRRVELVQGVRGACRKENVNRKGLWMVVGEGRAVSCPHAVDWRPGAPRSLNDVAMA